jgi:hypothetical protein
MIRKTQTVVALALTAAVCAPAAASAQDQTRLGAFKYWSAFTADAPDGKVCWAATAPISTDYSGDSRGDVFLMVSMWPSRGIDNEISIISGYGFDEKRTAQAKIGSDTYSFFTSSDGAWLETRREESAMVKSMKAGAKASVTGYSDIGSRSNDSFSLLGFTAAYNAARKACK